MAITWNEYFMEIANLSAKRSKDPKTQVGACIVEPNEKHIISIGYNGMPKGIEDNYKFVDYDSAQISTPVWDDDLKHKFVVHAEANAILNTNADLHGTTIYITQFPCNECAKLIAQKGIKRVIYENEKFRKAESGKYSEFILRKAGIDIFPYDKEEEF